METPIDDPNPVQTAPLTIEQRFPGIQTGTGHSHTHAYPGPDGLPVFHSFKIARIVNEQNVPSAFVFVASSTKNDPRRDDYVDDPSDSCVVIPMTEAAVYGLLAIGMQLRVDMFPDTHGMFMTMFQEGNFKRN